MEKRLKKGYSKLDIIYSTIFLFYIISAYTNSLFEAYFELMFYFITTIYFIFNYKKITITPYFIFQSLFIVMALISLLVTINLSVSLIELRKLIQILIIGVSLISFIDSKEKLYFFYNLLIIGGLSLLIILLSEIPPTEWFSRRLGGAEFGYNANEVGLTLSFSVILSIFMNRLKKNNLYLVLAVILIIAVLLTGSRKALLLAFAGISGVLLVNSSGFIKNIRIIAIVLILLGIGYYSIMNIPFLYDITGIRVEALLNSFTGDGDIDGSTIIRQQMVSKGISLFKESPIIGNGVGSFAILGGFGTYSHNNYIEVMVSTGIVGLFFYYLNYAYLISNLVKKKEKELVTPLLVIMLLLVLLETGLVTYNEIIFQIMIIMSYASLRIANKKENYSKR